MNIDETLNNDFGGKEFKIDPAMMSAQLLQYAITNNLYLISIMKKQHEIISLLETGSINKQKCNEEVAMKLNDINERVKKELYDILSSMNVK
ncbi:hypothetical protein [Chryseosolibacter indicus]|uniref:Uncharacterized protein n=1 Tax=Chryseosolibacter indicus TaxID=2782351 RepID=A0ABS5VLU2_9BACT|nr:hypothetical protein [Chryseosolibacter indicus]MBT1701795.1 hypothetical protein [Chryseosolibacter indicus]